MKVISLLSGEIDAINGPSHDDQPVFRWSDWPDMPHEGHPDAFDFDWVDNVQERL